MKRWFPILVILAGFGSFISSIQAAPTQKFSDPFGRYLKSVKTNQRESSLRRFATGCGVNVEGMKAKYAVSVGGGWQQVENLQKGLKSVESDFYTTAEVWKLENHVLVEMWPNSDDVGSEVRILYCFVSGKLQFTEAIQWNMRVMQNPDIRPWGYSRRWVSDKQKSMEEVRAGFVDQYERVIPRPKLDADDKESLRWSPPMEQLNDRKFPDDMLK
jgi:hypothetical protein